MKLSTRVRFGLRIMMQIASECSRKPVFAGRIAATQGISEAYVDQILMPLRAGGLLVSRRGRSGGYLLARPAEQITVLEIVETLEGRLNLVDCTENPASCERSPFCATHRLWCRLSDTIRETLEAVTLADVQEEQEALTPIVEYVI
ncbi:MAG: Rrf2 family transcriptional regulator [Kiritimatiellaeota bacterium]|nr:Rrf2 family transcriptional regulator [Kiritimatiellota bacterium]